VSDLRAVIFDIDGTLTDSVDVHALAWQEALRHFGHDLPYERVRRQIGKGGDQLLKALLSSEDLKRQGEELDQYRGDLFKRKYMHLIKPLSLVPQLFRRIRQNGLRIVLASSAKEDEVEFYTNLLGVGEFLASSTSSDDAEKSKPHPDIFAAALDRLGRPSPEAVIVIGDTPYDAQAATALKIACVGVLTGGWEAETLIKAGCQSVFCGPADLFARYDQSPLGHGSDISRAA
jgi:HAD superfamily hydrolase (TIGR01549 family)